MQDVLTGKYIVQEEDLEVENVNLTVDEFEAWTNSIICKSLLL